MIDERIIVGSPERTVTENGSLYTAQHHRGVVRVRVKRRVRAGELLTADDIIDPFWKKVWRFLCKLM